MAAQPLGKAASARQPKKSIKGTYRGGEAPISGQMFADFIRLMAYRVRPLVKRCDYAGWMWIWLVANLLLAQMD